MSVDKFNSEGYYDQPHTKHVQRENEERALRAFRPIVYICSPCRRDREKCKADQDYSRFAVEKGYIP